MDLAQVYKLSSWKANTKFFMVSVDVFSRFVRIQPMTKKNADTTGGVFIRTCSDQSNNLILPKNLWVGSEKEFFRVLRYFCPNIGIHINQTFSETKVCFAERTIRDLNSLTHKYLNQRTTDCYLPKLQSFLRILNTRVNRFTGLLPETVQNGDFMTSFIQRFDEHYQTSPKKVGEVVRNAKVSTLFSKGYKPQFTDEVFRVIDIKTTIPRVSHQLEDLNGDKIFCKFYPAELSKQSPLF